jgi:hypothetical protein
MGIFSDRQTLRAPSTVNAAWLAKADARVAKMKQAAKAVA